jgi:hypothetical protein
MEVRSGKFDFPPGTGERTQTMEFIFPEPVVEVHVALAGYEARYEGEDHHVRRVKIELYGEPGGHVDEGYEARVMAVFELEDDAQSTSSGSMDFVMFAQHAEPRRPPVHPLET